MTSRLAAQLRTVRSKVRPRGGRRAGHVLVAATASVGMLIAMSWSGCRFEAKNKCETDEDCLEDRVCGDNGICVADGCDIGRSITCADGSCAPESSQCDGIALCADGSDEFISWAGCNYDEGTCRSSERVFDELKLPVFLNCASCHLDGRPSGEGEAWGPGGDSSTWGWHSAFSDLTRREEPDTNVSQWAIVQAFAGIDDLHPEIPAARRAAEDWGVYYRDEGRHAECGVDCGAYSPRAAFTDELRLADIFVCATCHFNGTPSGTGDWWGPSGQNTADAWYDAVRTRLEPMTDLDGDPEKSILYTIWSNPSHDDLLINPLGVARNMKRWIERQWHCSVTLEGLWRDPAAPSALSANVCTGPIRIQFADNYNEPWVPQQRYRLELEGNGFTEIHRTPECRDGVSRIDLDTANAFEDVYVLGEQAGTEATFSVVVSENAFGPLPDDVVLTPLTYTVPVGE